MMMLWTLWMPSRYTLMSRPRISVAPSVRGSSAAYQGPAGSLMSTRAVASEHPTSAQSLPVARSVQPQMLLRMVPGSAPSAVSGTKATRSTCEQLKGPVTLSVQGVCLPNPTSRVRVDYAQHRALD